MVETGGELSMTGDLKARLIKGSVKPKLTLGLLRQRLKIAWAILRWKAGSKLSGQLSMIGSLHARKFDSKTGTWIDYGCIGVRQVTDLGVAFMVDDWDDDTTDITTLNWHDSGTGVNAEDQTDTVLQTPTGVARESGTKSQPAANQLRTVATITYDGSYAVVEHGIFSANSAGVLWDRTKFSVINVDDTDQIEFTYTLTCTAGG